MDLLERQEQIQFGWLMTRILCREFEEFKIGIKTLADNLDWIAGELDYLHGGLDESGTAQDIRDIALDLRSLKGYSEVLALISGMEWKLSTGYENE